MADSVMVSKVALVLTHGDIYRWRWKDGHEPKLMGSSQYAYHCKSCIAIVRNGLLIDTYWGDMSSDRAIDPDRVDLEYQGNESTLRPISEQDTNYYDNADIVDIRHANSSRELIYVKPGAVRKAERILEYLRYKRERKASAIQYAQNDIEMQRLSKSKAATSRDISHDPHTPTRRHRSYHR